MAGGWTQILYEEVCSPVVALSFAFASTVYLQSCTALIQSQLLIMGWRK